MDGESLKRTIEERLGSIPDLAAAHVEVRITGSTVTLAGSVDNHHGKLLAQDLAASFPHVQRVENLLVVLPDWAEERQPLETEFRRSSDARQVTETAFRLADSL
jgi:hypothetical protein